MLYVGFGLLNKVLPMFDLYLVLPSFYVSLICVFIQTHFRTKYSMQSTVLLKKKQFRD